MDAWAASIWNKTLTEYYCFTSSLILVLEKVVLSQRLGQGFLFLLFQEDHLTANIWGFLSDAELRCLCLWYTHMKFFPFPTGFYVNFQVYKVSLNSQAQYDDTWMTLFFQHAVSPPWDQIQRSRFKAVAQLPEFCLSRGPAERMLYSFCQLSWPW